MYGWHTAVQLAHTNREASSIIFCYHCFVLWAIFIHTQFHILIGGTEWNDLPSFHPVPSFNNNGIHTVYTSNMKIMYYVFVFSIYHTPARIIDINFAHPKWGRESNEPKDSLKVCELSCQPLPFWLVYSPLNNLNQTLYQCVLSHQQYLSYTNQRTKN